jgi:hypothetical protein
MYLASSTNTSQVNFRYVFDVYQSNGTTLIARVKLPARPSDNKGLFDAKRIIENYLSYSLPGANEMAEFYQNSQSFYKYTLKVGEEYDVTVGDVTTLTVFEALQTVSGKYVWNAALDWLEFQAFDHEDFILSSGGDGQLLTNAPLTQKIELGQNAWLYMATATSGTLKKAEFKKYYASGTVNTLSITGTLYNLTTSDGNRFLRLACGTANVEERVAGWIDEDVLYYTVQVLDSSDDPVSALMRYDITENCRYPTVRLHWLNKLGGFDSFNFTLKSRESLAVTKQQYRQLYGTTTGSWTYTPHDRGDVVFDTRARQSFKISSDWINEAESAWLEELITSPEVYVELDADTLVAVVLKNTSYEKKKKQNDRLFNLSLDYEYSFEKIRQRG